MLEFRYSNMLIVLAVAFFYSSGMPILYPIAAIFFIITYCTDKWLLFHYYKQPPMYNSYLARKTLKWFKYIILLRKPSSIIFLVCPKKGGLTYSKRVLS